MSDTKISDLTAITGADTAADDDLVIVDTSAAQTKRITRDELKQSVLATGVVANGSTIRTNLGLAIGTDVQAYDDQLTTISTLARTDGNIIVGDGSTWVVESGATARTSLGVDAAGTDNSTNVSLAGSLNYITISGQTITRNAIDLAADVTGTLPTSNVADDAITYAKIQNVTATNRVLGRDAAGAGVIEEISPAALRAMINVEDGATADQTNAEIRAAVEAATDSNVFTDADHTKLNGIAASANNYVHPNHSGEVTSTGDGATVVADNVIDEANLKVSNSPTNGYVLTAQSGNAGGLTWAAGSNSATWVNFNSISTLSITDSNNVSSVTDNGTGNFTVNFSSSLSSAGYALAGYGVAYSVTNVSGFTQFGLVPTGTNTKIPNLKSTSAVQILMGNPANGIPADAGDYSLSVVI